MQVGDNFIKLYNILEEMSHEYKKEINSFPKNNPDHLKLIGQKVSEFTPPHSNIMQQLGEITIEFSEAERDAHQKWLQEGEYWKSIHEAPFYRRIITKPEGYPGDFRLMEMIYRNTFEGETNWGKFIHKHAVESEASQAVRNRRIFLREQILELNLRGGGEIGILSLAAGPLKEIEDVLKQLPNDDRYEFLALDHDINALRHVHSTIEDKRLSYGIANAFHLMRKKYSVVFPRRYALAYCEPKTDFRGVGKLFSPLKYSISNLSGRTFDLVYTAGLYDYIRNKTKGAIALTKNLFQFVKPGGRLVIGNFSPKNSLSNRFEMEFLCDWLLIYRDESEMYRLADGIPEAEIAEMTLLEEPLGINYFLKIVKRE